MATLALVHTVRRVIPGLSDLATELLPEARQLHFLDESTLQEAVREGGLTAGIVRRVCTLILLAAESADAVLVTCSSIGPCVEVAARMTAVPVLRIDRPMAEQAVAAGEHVGVIATLMTTLDPTAGMVEQCAKEAGKGVQVTRALCVGAFDAATRGDQAEHDRLVLQGLQELVRGGDPVDAVVLAQASMAAVAAQLPPDLKTPILASPRSGLLRAGEVLRGQRQR